MLLRRNSTSPYTSLLSYHKYTKPFRGKETGKQIQNRKKNKKTKAKTETKQKAKTKQKQQNKTHCIALIDFFLLSVVSVVGLSFIKKDVD